MKLFTRTVAIFFITSCTWSVSGQPQEFKPTDADAAGFSADRLQRLDKFLEGFVNDKKVPNVVTFIARNGKVVHHKAYGMSNIESARNARVDDIFRWASQTKAITTTALMILYEEGKFLLEDPVSLYIPEFAAATVLDSYDEKTKKYTSHPVAKPVTIRHLLSHTAGISYDNPVPGEPRFDKLDFLPGNTEVTLKETVPLLAKRPLLHEPGEAFTYGPNIDVVGYLVEILSGMPLDQFFAKRIFEPLGMNDTYFYLPAAKSSRLVELYSLANATDKLMVSPVKSRRNFPLAQQGKNFLGGAGLVGSIEDYAKFCQMIANGGTFNGKQILGRKTIGLMSRNQIGDLTVWDRNDKFGLGFQIISEDTRYADQATPGSLTWGGMFSTEYTIDPAEGLVMLVYTNVDPYYYERELERKFRILVYQALE